MARIGTDAWFGEIEDWLRDLVSQLPQIPEPKRAELHALIAEIEGVRVVRGRMRVVRRIPNPI